ncbi:MAG: general secretion pathway protein GspB, partial [Mariprofundus sp.]
IDEKVLIGSENPVPLFSPITPASQVARSISLQTDAADAFEPSAADNNIVSISELPVHILQAVPSIDIQGHIYDNKPASRMVIINGRVVKEKKTISNGLILEEITPDGVILSFQKHVFHMGVFDK